MNLLNNHPRTAFDDRNDEARIHDGHELLELRRRWVDHPTVYGYDEVDVVCLTCNKRYKARLWADDAPKGGDDRGKFGATTPKSPKQEKSE